MKVRKLYDPDRQRLIPSTKVTCKLLFPRNSIYLWIMNYLEADQAPVQANLPVLAGSHDLLLEWATREVASNLAFLRNGNGDGVTRLVRDEAMVAGVHVIDHGTGNYNDPAHAGLSVMRVLVIVHCAWRTQGLLTQPGNPRGMRELNDLTSSRSSGPLHHAPISEPAA